MAKYKNNAKEGIDYVVCKICEKQLKKITNTHLKKHNITIDEYHKRYPNKRTESKQLSDYRKRNIKNKSYEEQFGKEKANKIRKKKSKTLTDYDFEKRTCKMCGNTFHAKESSTQQYCSRKCVYESQRKGTKIISCANCNKEFVVNKNSLRQFCSHKCSNEFKKKKYYMTVECSNCGKKIKISNKEFKNDKNRFCSLECKKQFNSQDSINYRNKAYGVYGKYCARCNSTENLVVHHIDGNRMNNTITNLTILCRSCHKKRHKIMKEQFQKFVGQNSIENGMILMLQGLRSRFGLDISDINFRDTPKRVARAYEEIFEGINAKDEIKNILSTHFPTEYDGMITESPIRCYSMCPHHFLPVIYDVAIGYIPRKGGLGLSKLPRLIELLAKAPKLQEDFTKEIIDSIEKSIKPLGAIVKVKGEHLCMQMRGVKKPGCGTTTCSFSGVFKEPATRKEFYDTVGR